MNKTKIDWADMTWNPVTGCLHGCEYCYARKIAKRFGNKYMPFGNNLNVLDCPVNGVRGIDPYPFGFEPTLHLYRLADPVRAKKSQTIFVCSMADLFGQWVPDEWIQEVFRACEAAPWHRYLFLTKNPKRYEQVLDRYFPSNMYFGWSQDGPMGDALNHSTHHSIQSFVSLEPLLRPFESFSIRGVDWVIIGAETGNRKGKVIPEKKWIDDIVEKCRQSNIPGFHERIVALTDGRRLYSGISVDGGRDCPEEREGGSKMKTPNNLTLSCVVTVDLAADKYNGEIFITDHASVSDRLGLILTAKAELEEMADTIVRQYGAEGEGE